VQAQDFSFFLSSFLFFFAAAALLSPAMTEPLSPEFESTIKDLKIIQQCGIEFVFEFKKIFELNFELKL